MCGLAGFSDRRPSRTGGAEALADQVRRMAQSLKHRGPDGEGVWVDALAGVALGHQRLSINDTSSQGAQPMQSGNGRYVIAYNGEIYNFRELRQELERRGHPFRGHSDTEVIAEGFASWGIEETVRRLLGMFAIAVWDKQARSLTLIRDRMGVKPLYWSYQSGLFLFGSELKALRRFDGFRPYINPAAVGDMVAYSYIAAPHSIYHGVNQLMPGTMLRLTQDGRVHSETYWDLGKIVRTARAGTVPAETEASEALAVLLKDAVARRMVADVPLGAFLSGGVDSALVVALMQAQSTRRVRTFTIGFAEDRLNEAPFARQVADILGTDHTEHLFTAQDALRIVPQLADIYDEPFGDSSQLPVYLLSAMTRRHVRVALSGDGGDELFAGYGRYLWYDRISRGLRLLPPLLRRSVAGLLLRTPVARLDKCAARLPARFRLRQPGEKLHQLAAAMGAQDRGGLYQILMQQGEAPDRFLRHPPPPRIGHALPVSDASFIPHMQFDDMQAYLPGDILTKLDRASMAAGLEAREPLLDHRLVEFSWSLPMHLKMRDGGGKWILRQLLGRYLPPALIDRPKAGFAVPLQEWLRGPLRDWGAALLAPEALGRDEFFDAPAVWAAWERLQKDSSASPQLLWNVLMFQAWKQRWHG
ncbi:MAG: asparagine synthase (glutamine-hydrolyzing) [Alphaproteobacteria bacterium]|nr:asparagine synthase (glutamine-hydrolyzing) [Alphaproteobacteria bacterium]